MLARARMSASERLKSFDPIIDAVLGLKPFVVGFLAGLDSLSIYDILLPSLL